MYEEDCYPRGGLKPSLNKTNFHPRSHSDNQGNLFGLSAKKKSSKKRQRSDSHGPKSRQARDDIAYRSSSAEALSFKTAQEGMLVLGCVKDVSPLALTIELPGVLYCTLQVNCISEAFTQQLSERLESGIINEDKELRTLRSMFKQGQFIPTRIIQTELTGIKAKVFLSAKPSDVNANYYHSDFRNEMLIWAAVIEKSDHGYILDVGVKHVRIILPFKHVEDGKEYVIGEPLWCVVKSATSSNQVTTLSVSALQGDVDTSKLREASHVEKVLPGTCVIFRAEKGLRNGLEGTILTDSVAYVNEAHLPEPLTPMEKYLGETLPALVLYVQPTTRFSYLTLRTTRMELQPNLSVGQILQAQVISRAERGIFVKLSKKDRGFITPHRIRNSLNLTDFSDLEALIEAKYPKGSTHKCRILDYAFMDNLYGCTFEQHVLDEKIFTVADVKVGEIVRGTVQDIKQAGITLKIGNLRAFVNNEHLSNARYSEVFKSKFKPGQTVTGRVWLNKGPSNIKITLKSAFLESDVCLKDYEEAQVNSQYPGMVVKITASGALIKFYDDVQGWLKQAPNSRHPLRQLLYQGQVVSVWVVDKEDTRLTLSLEAPVTHILTPKEEDDAAPEEKDNAAPDLNDPEEEENQINETEDPEIDEESDSDNQEEGTSTNNLDNDEEEEVDEAEVDSEVKSDQEESPSTNNLDDDEEEEEIDEAEVDSEVKSDQEESPSTNNLDDDEEEEIDEADVDFEVKSDQEESPSTNNLDGDDEEEEEEEEVDEAEVDSEIESDQEDNLINFDNDEEEEKTDEAEFDSEVESDKDQERVTMQAIDVSSEKQLSEKEMQIEETQPYSLVVGNESSDLLDALEAKRIRRKTKLMESLAKLKPINRKKKMEDMKPHQLKKTKRIKKLKESLRLIQDIEDVLYNPVYEFNTDNKSVLPGVQHFFDSDKEEDVVRSSEDDDAEPSEAELHKSKKRKLSHQEQADLLHAQEEYLRKKEEELVNSDGIPQNVEQFDRRLLGEPNSSELWAQYIAFHIQSTEIDKARAVVQRALKTIQQSAVQERLNIWITYLNLEGMYGTRETFDEVFEEAVRCNDALTIYLEAIKILAESSAENADEKIRKAKSKFKQDVRMYIEVGKIYYKQNRLADARRLKDGALRTILDKKKHVPLIVQFAIMEFINGEENHGEALFETILQSDPRRTDVWGTYVDQLVKRNKVDLARRVLQRAVAQKLNYKKMKVLYKKFQEFEQKYGTRETQAHVRELLQEYASEFVDA